MQHWVKSNPLIVRKYHFSAAPICAFKPVSGFLNAALRAVLPGSFNRVITGMIPMRMHV